MPEAPSADHPREPARSAPPSKSSARRVEQSPKADRQLIRRTTSRKPCGDATRLRPLVRRRLKRPAQDHEGTSRVRGFSSRRSNSPDTSQSIGNAATMTSGAPAGRARMLGEQRVSVDAGVRRDDARGHPSDGHRCGRRSPESRTDHLPPRARHHCRSRTARTRVVRVLSHDDEPAEGRDFRADVTRG